MTKHVVGFSGGIDSQACATWVLNRHGPENTVLLNSEAGRNEHPLTTEHVQWFSKNVHPVIEVVPLVVDMGGCGKRGGDAKEWRDKYADDDELTFPDMAKMKRRFPSRKAQFCTEKLKLMPQLRWLNENLGDVEIVRYAGVRRDESPSRADVAFEEFDTLFDCTLRRPIADWTKGMCFEFCKAHGQRINPLYEMGFARVGCAPCINSSKADILNWATRFPEMINKVRGWEKVVGRTFFPPIVPGKPINWIDEVVAWANTTFGGKHTMLPLAQAEADSGACVSKYGLCD